jgi:hypothetical protein
MENPIFINWHFMAAISAWSTAKTSETILSVLEATM